ncbi:flagellar basal-body rod protein FlgF [Sneathiella sp. P13V-1]|uniref:flagellar basal-body rod protein FlgF n=1 Tax=Sneathiella sp. P13V-1 TaxID=2697366 RepID=UPI00187BAFBE|nr:flagellar basal-body rod protein FlgF [Sneathiella sp. P13V-1]MBE7638306.1 flagellar basal-body rod protein FlgF [Sneathiella sp. P13V-1]
MENAVYIGLSQQMALKRHLDIVANNIANMNTTAYKVVRPVFQEYLVDEPFKDKMAFVQDYGVYHDRTEGTFTETGRPLDLAISGDGYFSIQTDQGIRYTRNGNFKFDTEGNVITAAGDYLVDDRNDRIQVELSNPNIEIASDGTVNLGTEDTVKIQLYRFDNEQIMKQEGNGYYNPNGAAPIPAEESRIMQGSLEGSNVTPVLEMTTMIEIMRTYQAAQKLLDAEHEMQMKAIEELPAMN